MGLDIYFNTEDGQTELGYLRKCNIVYAHFAEVIDDEENARVTKEDLAELVELCNNVLTKHEELGLTSEFVEYASVTLPTQGGFFFGSTEYGEDYLYQVERTKEVLEELLQKVQEGEIVLIDFWW
nr:MAG TPA: hypothetical protein [Caudoviricetes sp.]